MFRRIFVLSFAIAAFCVVSAYASLPDGHKKFALTAGATPMSKSLAGPYTRAWVRKCSRTDLLRGSWKKDDLVIDTFTLMDNRPELDGRDANAWIPLECRCKVMANGQDPVFLGCWNGVNTTSDARPDSPDPRFVEDSEVYAATEVKLSVVRPPADAPSGRGVDRDSDEVNDDDDLRHGNGNSVPVVRARFPYYTPTYAEQIRWVFDFRNRDVNDDSIWITPQISKLHRYFMSFIVDAQLNDHVAEIEQLFEPVVSTYEVTDFFNTSTAAGITAYNLLASFKVAESIMNLDMLRVAYTQVGHLVQAQIHYDTFYPRILPETNPLRHWYNKYAMKVSSSRNGLLRNADHMVNFLGALSRRAASPPLNRTEVCLKMDRVCNPSVIMNQFPANDPRNANGARQYATVSDCLTYLNSLPDMIGVDLNKGKSASCVRFHLDISGTSLAGAQGHCLHSGPLSLGSLTPCQ